MVAPPYPSPLSKPPNSNSPLPSLRRGDMRRHLVGVLAAALLALAANGADAVALVVVAGGGAEDGARNSHLSPRRSPMLAFCGGRLPCEETRRIRERPSSRSSAVASRWEVAATIGRDDHSGHEAGALKPTRLVAAPTRLRRCLAGALAALHLALVGAALLVPTSGSHATVAGDLPVASATSAAAAAAPVAASVSVPAARLAAPPLTAEETRVIDLFEASKASVVYINTFVNARDAITMNVLEVPSGTGSGIVWDKEGFIVTNFHVVRQANTAEIRVTTPDGKQESFRATVRGYDPDKDVAVLKINAPRASLQPVEVGSSGALRVGQSVLAIGCPFGLDHSLTTGVVSGLGREMRSPTGKPISNVIQIDAAINPGNSGGPSYNSAGQLIGMNTAIFSPSGASAGVGFAIPSDSLVPIVDQIIRTGSVVRPAIGITYLEGNQARALGIKEGVLVLGVPSGSEAEKAGIRGTTRSRLGAIELGDVIVALDDVPIASELDLFRCLEGKRPGDVVDVQVVRTEDGRQARATLKLRLQQQLQQPASLMRQFDNAPAPAVAEGAQ
jgi:S1-C subfamily serine protease